MNASGLYIIPIPPMPPIPPPPPPGMACFFSGLSDHEAFGGQHQGGDRRSVLQRGAGHLGGIDDPGLDQVDHLAGRCVQARSSPWRPRPAGTTTAPSRPALSAMRRARGERATPTRCEHRWPRRRSSDCRRPSATAARARTRAVPPPATTPSSMAARVADTASSMRCFFSFSSTSVAAPTLMTATPPASLARRSCSFSRSQSLSVLSISALIWLMRPATSSAHRRHRRWWCCPW